MMRSNFRIYKLIPFCLILLAPAFLNAQSFDWAFKSGGLSDEDGKVITKDNQNKLLTAGTFVNTLVIGGNTYTSSNNSQDVFVAKRNEDGSSLWSFTLASGGEDAVEGIAVDIQNNVYITGWFQGTMDMDPASGNEYSLVSSSGSLDVFLAKYSPNGEFLWARKFGGSLPDRGFGIDLDQNGNIFATGTFRGILDVEPFVSTDNITSVGSDDIFVVKFNSLGEFQWSKAMGSTQDEFATEIKVASAGNVFFSGYFQNTVDFNPGTATSNATSLGISDGFVCALDNNGIFLWKKTIGGTGIDKIEDIDIDPSGNIVAGGTFSSTVDLSAGSALQIRTSSGQEDIFITKFSPSGGYLTAYYAGGTQADLLTSVDVDLGGNVFFGGVFSGTCEFDFIGGGNLKTAVGNDGFVGRLDGSSILAWVNVVGASQTDQVKDVCATAAGRVVCTGSFQQTVDFDTSSDNFLLTATDNRSDAFWLKLTPCREILLTASGCSDEGYQLGGITIFQSGIYDQVFASPSRCDSLVSVQVFMLNSANIELDTTICSGSGIFFAGAQRTQPGTYEQVFPGGFGCDSTVVLNLAVAPEFNTNQSVNLCNNETLSFGELIISSSGTYSQNLHTNFGCDSVVNLTVVLKPVYNVSVSGVRCIDEPYMFGNEEIFTPGFHIQTFQSLIGCDSIVTLNLSVLPEYSSSGNVAICEGETFQLGNQTISVPGNYSDTLQSFNGCDSLVFITVTAYENQENYFGLIKCSNDEFHLGSQTILGAGVFEEILQDVHGCDSLVNVFITNIPISTNDVYGELCPGEGYFFESQLYTTPGDYLFYYSNSLGCDSILTLHLDFQDFNTTLVLDGDTLFTPQENVEYQWVNCSLGNTVVPGATDSSFLPVTNGSYAVILNNNNCYSISECVFVDVLGIEELGNKLRIYPNPASDQIIFIRSNGDSNAWLTLIDSAGNVVLRNKCVGLTGQIDSTELASGLYTILYEETDAFSQYRLVVAH
jgi:Secretion system C-terminal sorting domain